MEEILRANVKNNSVHIHYIQGDWIRELHDEQTGLMTAELEESEGR